MLTLHPQSGKLRHANNLVPTRAGGLASRPGAVQVVSGDIASAVSWGNRLLMEKLGRLRLWDGLTETDIAPAGRGLQATAFQALTSEAQREDRLYVADGVRPLWYVARRAAVYARYGIANTVLDAGGVPYALAPAQAVATWRGRLWTVDGGNRAQHCQFDAPEEWDPLWVVECQGPRADRIVALEADDKRLLAGLKNSVWEITGDSQYNWQRDPIADYGVAGPNAMVSDTQLLFWISSVGLHLAGRSEPLSEDLREAFTSPPYPAEVVIDGRRRLLLIFVSGRLFVMHLEKPGLFGEITGQQVHGLLQTDDYTGWYGGDGVWLLGARDEPDHYLDGTRRNVISLYDTWEDIPNPNGGGRAHLPCTIAKLNGSSRADAVYTVIAKDVEGEDTYSASVSLADEEPEVWTDDIAGLHGEPWPTAAVRREFPVQLAGSSFRHQLEAPCHMEVLAFDPQYKFGAKEDE
jgi:hypothetical protein